MAVASSSTQTYAVPSLLGIAQQAWRIGATVLTALRSAAEVYAAQRSADSSSTRGALLAATLTFVDRLAEQFRPGPASSDEVVAPRSPEAGATFEPAKPASASAAATRKNSDLVWEWAQRMGFKNVVYAWGSSEHSLTTALIRASGLKPVLALDESAAVSIATGEAQARNAPSLLMLHSTPGSGKGHGHLWDALHKGAPMVVVVGEAQMDNLQKHMQGDIVKMADGNVAHAERLTRPEDLEVVLNRAYQRAVDAQGPALVVLPQDMMGQATEAQLAESPLVVPNAPGMPARGIMDTLEERVAAFRNPAIIIGDGVFRANAQDELAAFAAQLGAKVYGGMSSLTNLNPTDPLYAGQLNHMFPQPNVDRLAPHDGVIVIGSYPDSHVFPGAENWLKDKQVVQIDAHKDNLNANWSAALPVYGDPKVILPELSRLLSGRSDEYHSEASARAQRAAEEIVAARSAAVESVQQSHPGLADFCQRLARRIAEELPQTVLQNEALTSGAFFTVHDEQTIRDRRFDQTTPGGTLGSWPQVIGQMLATGRPGLALVGDGGFTMNSWGLRAAAEQGLPLGMVIFDNGKYQILQNNAGVVEPERAEEAGKAARLRAEGVEDPNYALVAQGMIGEDQAIQVLTSDPASFDGAIERMIASMRNNRPFVISLKS